MYEKNQLIYIPYSCFVFFFLAGKPTKEAAVYQIDPAVTARFADSVGGIVKPQLAEGLTASLWGIDSLVKSPIAIDIDDQGRLYYTTTDRQKNSEFDIRGHRDWEIPSISLQTVEDRRKFLHTEFSPENSYKNKWLKDLNGDSSHDWQDLTVEKEYVFGWKIPMVMALLTNRKKWWKIFMMK